MKKIDSKVIQSASRVLRTIGHPDRLRIVEALESSSKTVKTLMGELRLPQAVLSKHLSVLRQRGIVRSAAKQNFRYYSIAYKNVIHILNCLRAHGGGRP